MNCACFSNFHKQKCDKPSFITSCPALAYTSRSILLLVCLITLCTTLSGTGGELVAAKVANECLSK